MDMQARLKKVQELCIEHNVIKIEINRFVDFEFLVENYSCAAILSVISQIKSTR